MDEGFSLKGPLNPAARLYRGGNADRLADVGKDVKAKFRSRIDDAGKNIRTPPLVVYAARRSHDDQLPRSPSGRMKTPPPSGPIMTLESRGN